VTVESWVALIVAVAGAIGLRELIAYRMKRRDDQSDVRHAEQTKRSNELSVVEAGANAAILQTLLTEMRGRIDSYEASIRDMRDMHVKDMAEVKAENRQLDRQVQDLRASLRDYQLGNRVPRGQVLLPLREVRRLREKYAGALDASWYPGEDLDPEDPASSIVARITPMQQQGPEQRVQE